MLNIVLREIQYAIGHKTGKVQPNEDTIKPHATTCGLPLPMMPLAEEFPKSIRFGSLRKGGESKQILDQSIGRALKFALGGWWRWEWISRKFARATKPVETTDQNQPKYKTGNARFRDLILLVRIVFLINRTHFVRTVELELALVRG